jgi:hypothetical protein
MGDYKCHNLLVEYNNYKLHKTKTLQQDIERQGQGHHLVIKSFTQDLFLKLTSQLHPPVTAGYDGKIDVLLCAFLKNDI